MSWPIPKIKINKLTIELFTVSKKHVETPLLIQMSWIVIFGGQNLMVDSMLRSIKVTTYIFSYVCTKIAPRVQQIV